MSVLDRRDKRLTYLIRRIHVGLVDDVAGLSRHSLSDLKIHFSCCAPLVYENNKILHLDLSL